MLQRKSVRIVSTLILSLFLVLSCAASVEAVTTKDITTLQTFLEQKGLLVIPKGNTKGNFGPATKKALIKYQQSIGLPAEGHFGSQTQAKIAAELSGSGDHLLIASVPTATTSNQNVSRGELDTRLQQLNNSFLSKLSTLTAQSGSAVTPSVNHAQMALANRIDQLTNTTINTPTISNPVITGGSLSGTSVSASSLSTAGSLSAATSSLSALTVTGSTTLLGSTTIAGLTVTGLNPGLTLGSIAFQGASALAQDNANLFYDSLNHRLGIGTSSPAQLLQVGTTLYVDNANTRIGIGTNSFSPNSILQLGNGTGLFVTNTRQLITSNNFIDIESQGGEAFTGVRIGDYNDTISLGGSSGATPRLIVQPSGNVGIATTSPWRTLSVTGSVGFDGLTTGPGAGALCLSANKEVLYLAGSTACLTSSKRFKHDIVTSTTGLDFVNKLRPVTYTYNDNIGIPGEQFGFIAEEVEALDPRLVVHDASSTPFSVRYENLTAVLAKAIQEVSGKFDGITAWLGNAGNGIAKIFVGEINATDANIKTLCVTNDSGKTCITRNQLDTLLANSGKSSTGNSTSQPIPPSEVATTTSSVASSSPTQTGETPVVHIEESTTTPAQ